MDTYSSEFQCFRVFCFEGGRLFQALHTNLGTVLFDIAGAALSSVCEGGLHTWFKLLNYSLQKSCHVGGKLHHW